MLKETQRYSIKIEKLPPHNTRNCCFKRDFPNGHSTLYSLCWVTSQTTHFLKPKNYFPIKNIFYLQGKKL